MAGKRFSTVAYFPERTVTNDDSFDTGEHRSGIDITFWHRPKTITVSGWYDSMVGIESTTVSLRSFFDRLGITEADCHAAFNPNPTKGKKT